MIVRKSLNFFEIIFKFIADFFYDLRHRNVRFRQQINILTMTGETLLPYEIMKEGDEFYLQHTSLDQVEIQLSRINRMLAKQFVAIKDEELIRVIRIK
jgi:hypothetical protein